MEVVKEVFPLIADDPFLVPMGPLLYLIDQSSSAKLESLSHLNPFWAEHYIVLLFFDIRVRTKSWSI